MESCWRPSLEEIRAALEAELDAAPADARAGLKQHLTMDRGAACCAAPHHVA